MNNKTKFNARKRAAPDDLIILVAILDMLDWVFKLKVGKNYNMFWCLKVWMNVVVFIDGIQYEYCVKQIDDRVVWVGYILVLYHAP